MSVNCRFTMWHIFTTVSSFVLTYSSASSQSVWPDAAEVAEVAEAEVAEVAILAMGSFGK